MCTLLYSAKDVEASESEIWLGRALYLAISPYIIAIFRDSNSNNIQYKLQYAGSLFPLTRCDPSGGLTGSTASTLPYCTSSLYRRPRYQQNFTAMGATVYNTLECGPSLNQDSLHLVSRTHSPSVPTVPSYQNSRSVRGAASGAVPCIVANGSSYQVLLATSFRACMWLLGALISILARPSSRPGNSQSAPATICK